MSAAQRQHRDELAGMEARAPITAHFAAVRATRRSASSRASALGVAFPHLSDLEVELLFVGEEHGAGEVRVHG